MKINFDEILLDLQGQPIVQEPGTDKATTLGWMCVTALTMVIPSEGDVSGKEKYERFLLACKCKGEADLAVEEVVKIKDLIGKVSGPVVVGRAWNLLEGRPQ